MTEASASVGLLLATALLVWDVYVADPLKRSVQEKKRLWSMPKSDSSTRIPSDWKELLRMDQNKETTITI